MIARLDYNNIYLWLFQKQVADLERERKKNLLLQEDIDQALIILFVQQILHH